MAGLAPVAALAAVPVPEVVAAPAPVAGHVAELALVAVAEAASAPVAELNHLQDLAASLLPALPLLAPLDVLSQQKTAF